MRRKLQSLETDKTYLKAKITSMTEKIENHDKEVEKIEKEKENLSTLLKAS